MAEADAAVAIVRARAPEDSLLLIRRTERPDDPWSGHWSLPGGRRDPDDPDLLHTALRELQEECGVRLGRECLESALAIMMARRRTGPPLRVAPFVFHVGHQLPVVLDPREAAGSLWMPVRVLLDPAEHRLHAVPGVSAETRFPGIELNGVPLWGFTYRLLTDWLGLAPEGSPAATAGFEAANHVLEFLLSRGLELARGWDGNTALVKGVIPVSEVLERFSAKAGRFPAVNRLVARPDCVHITGLAFEEYFIRTSP